MNADEKIKRFFKEKEIEIVVLFYILVVLIVGLTMQPFDELIEGLIKICMEPGTLITDYMVVGGMGPAFVNAAVVALIGYCLLILNKVSFTGISVAAVFTMMGFALMGKNIFSIMPIIVGVAIYSKLAGHKFAVDIYSALFGTALAPIVPQVSFGFDLGIFGGIVVGILVGILIPPIASHVLKFHEGYSLYNIGFAAGFIGLIFYNILNMHGHNSESMDIWGRDYDTYLIPFSIILFLSMIILGLILGKGSHNDYFKILKESGVSGTDFIHISGFGNTLINMGLVGLIGVAYIYLVKGDFNGPTLAGLLTMAGFAAYGKHPRNIIPIMAGVWIGTLFTEHTVNDPGPLLAALFGTTLAPVAGKFGPIVGTLAGFVHLAVVSNIGVVHGSLNLYNNGFSAGFVAAFFVALSKGINKNNN